MHKVYKASGDQKVKHFLAYQLRSFAKSLSDNLDQIEIEKLIADRIYVLSKKYNLENYVFSIPDAEKEVKYNVKYHQFFSIKVNEFRSVLTALSIEELGLLMALLAQIDYNTNKICIKDTNKHLKKIDIKNLLQITFEKCSDFLNKLIELNILSQGDEDYKMAYYVSYDYGFQKNPASDRINSKRNKVTYSKTIKVSTTFFDDPIFQKANKSERKSEGKEILGLFFRLVLLMNSQQEIRTRFKIGIILHIKKSIHCADFDKYFKILEQHNFIHQDKNIVYVNPVYAKYYRDKFSEKVREIFNIKLTY
jgi:hypothetical protein